MRFRGKQQRIRYRRRPCARRLLLSISLVPIAFVLSACGSDASDSISVLSPSYGAGTVRLGVELESNYVEDSLEVSLDRRLITDAFEFDGRVVSAEVPIAAGEHQLSVRARFAAADRSVSGEQKVRLAPPPALPDLLASDPMADSPDVPDVPVSAWLRLDFARPTDAVARESFELRCGGAERPVVVHAPWPETLIVNPVRDLPGRVDCTLAWRAGNGPQWLAFTTARAGPPARVFYDRKDAQGTAPFPDDFWLRADPLDPGRQRLRIEMGGIQEPDGLIVEALLHGTRELDGFSPIAHFTLPLSEAPDPDSLPTTPGDSLDPTAAVGLFELTPGSPDFGRRVPFRLEARTSSARGIVSHALLLFPSVALNSGGRYGVVVTRRMVTGDGRPFEPSRFFARVRDGEPSPRDEAAVKRARDLTGEVIDVVSGSGDSLIRRTDVALALRVTVRTTDHFPDDLRAIKQDILEWPPPRVRITSVESESPERRARGSAVAAIVRGIWDAPDWREHRLKFSRDRVTGKPQRVTTKPLPFVLALPDAAREGPVPLILYQHGNPGSAEEEVVPHARQSLAGAGFAVIGFTDALNRETSRPGASAHDRAFDQIVRIMWHVMVLKTMPDYFVETNAEQLAFLRAIDELAKIGEFELPGTAAAAAVTLFGIDSTAPLGYVGVSEGANLAPPFLAFAPEVRAAALIAGGRRFAEVLIHQEPETILAPFADLGASRLGATDVWVMLSLFQTLLDPQDGYNFAPYLYRRPFEVAGSKRRASILLSEGIGDAAVPNHVTEALARELGPIPQLLPGAQRVALLPAANSPISGNIDERTTAALTQFVPQGVAGIPATPGCASPPLSARSAEEGHYCVQNAAEALLQRLVFLETALTGGAPTILNPVAR
jgi:hypothetical protein